MRANLTLISNDIRHFAYNMASRLIQEMFQNIPSVNTKEDIEYLHDMRVASRRLRQTLQLFQSLYPPGKFKKTLPRVKRITRVLGLPREMDVNLGLLQSFDPNLDPLAEVAKEYFLEFFEFKQAKLRRKMLNAFKKLSLKALNKDLIRFAGTGLNMPGRPGTLIRAQHESETEVYLNRVAGVLRDQAKSVLAFKFTPKTEKNDEALHRLRIAVKKFRYTLEIYNPLLNFALEEAIKVSKDLQEILGKIHDASVLIEHLNGQVHDLILKNRPKLAEGAQKVISFFEARKFSLYPRVKPAHFSWVERVSVHLAFRGGAVGKAKVEIRA